MEGTFEDEVEGGDINLASMRFIGDVRLYDIVTFWRVCMTMNREPNCSVMIISETLSAAVGLQRHLLLYLIILAPKTLLKGDMPDVPTCSTMYGVT